MKIVIQEKPESISWDTIHETLMAAHVINREKGVFMKFPTLSGEEIRQKFEGGRGKMFVALDGDKVVGTAAFMIKQGYFWYCKEKYLYLCFAGVLPEYAGSGIYKKLCLAREEAGRQLGINVMVFDTNANNSHVIEVNQKNGFRKVSFKDYHDHYNVVLAKFLGDNQPSPILRSIRYYERQLRVKVLHLLKQ